MLRKLLTGIVISSLAALTSTAALADGFTLKDKPKIAMLDFGPKNDGGWGQAFDEARQKMEAALGQKVMFVESIPEDASAIDPVVERFISRGANIIIGTAFGYSDAFRNATSGCLAARALNASE
jgi:basic membrane protein A